MDVYYAFMHYSHPQDIRALCACGYLPKGLWTSSYLQCSSEPRNRLIILIFSQSLSPSHVVITDHLSGFSQCELHKDMYK